MLYVSNFSSPIGNFILYSDGKHLIHLNTEFNNSKIIKSEQLTNGDNLTCIKETQRWLDIYFSGKSPTFIPSVLLKGTSFQQQVWQILQTIPYGTLKTYGDIAKIIARERNLHKMSAQAIGQAVGANPCCIIVPCHRVISKNGSLTGYAGGLLIKQKLLLSEGIDISRLSIPSNSKFL